MGVLPHPWDEGKRRTRLRRCYWPGVYDRLALNDNCVMSAAEGSVARGPSSNADPVAGRDGEGSHVDIRGPAECPGGNHLIRKTKRTEVESGVVT